MFKRLSIAAVSTLMTVSLAIPVHAAGSSSTKSELIVVQQSNKMYDNGQLFSATQPTIVKQGVTYVAARSITSRLGLSIAYNSSTKQYVVSNKETELRYKLNSSMYIVNGTNMKANGLPYIKSGSLMIPIRSLVNPLSMKLSVNSKLKQVILTSTKTPDDNGSSPNAAPEAYFTTNKVSYKKGEKIVYTDLSTDDKGITKREWVNNKERFFTSGEQIVTLRVTDAGGLVSEYSYKLMISEETLISEEDYSMISTPIGDKFAIDSASVLKFPIISYTPVSTGQQTLIRANSPETIREEGIYYSDTVSGNVRFLIHNQNNRSNAVRIYIVATNEGSIASSVRSGRIGIGGPSTYVSATGKNALARYLEATANNTNVVVPAGQSRVVLSEISNVKIGTGKVITAHADITTDNPMKLSVVVVDDGKDVLQALPILPVLPWDGIHARGTFENGNRSINVQQSLGGSASRMLLADKTYDWYLPGIDATTGEAALNSGNYGVNYEVNLENVQPNTLIALNARGGHYGGAFLVNGKLTYMTNANILNNSGEAGVLYRTGSQVENVKIEFSPASGSNLPINLLFLPLPKVE
ncbi:MAG: copper amine oxidase N-terminal domain-containing protein [Candidatus Pristimantibacillus sp.]